MCDSFKTDIETVEEAIGEVNYRLSDIRSDILRVESNERETRKQARETRKRLAGFQRSKTVLRARLSEERQVMKSLREELRELKPSRKPRKAKHVGFPVTDLQFSQQLVAVPAGFEVPEVQSTSIYD